MQPGPLATYPRWRELRRQVRRGEKAITLCMPVTVKHARETESGDDVEVFTRFIYRPNWFVRAQTDGEPLAENPIPAWDANRALAPETSRSRSADLRFNKQVFVDPESSISETGDWRWRAVDQRTRT
jgi:hypothetical protein